jgi:hypothetical protein
MRFPHLFRQLCTFNLILNHSSLMMEAIRTSETSVDNYFTRQYIPEDNSEHHTGRRENLKSHILLNHLKQFRQVGCMLGWSTVQSGR